MTIDNILPLQRPRTGARSLQRLAAMRPKAKAPAIQLQEFEIRLARVVGARGAQALIAQAVAACGSRKTSTNLQSKTALKHASKFLGQTLATRIFHTPHSTESNGISPIHLN